MKCRTQTRVFPQHLLMVTARMKEHKKQRKEIKKKNEDERRFKQAWNKVVSSSYSNSSGLYQGPLQLQALVSTKCRLINSLFFNNFNISSVFGTKNKFISYNPSSLHSQTPRPGAVEGLEFTLPCWPDYWVELTAALSNWPWYAAGEIVYSACFARGGKGSRDRVHICCPQNWSFLGPKTSVRTVHLSLWFSKVAVVFRISVFATLPRGWYSPR